MRTYRISQLAARSGVPATTLRFYEREGLLPTQRSTSGCRLYDDVAVERLAFISAGKHLGLPLQFGLVVAQLGRARKQLDTAARPGRCDPECPFLQQTAPAAAASTAWPDGATTPAPLAPLAAPVASSLGGRARAEQLGQWHVLVMDAVAVEEIDCGVRVSLPVDRLSDAAGLAAAEQECCPFLAFHLHLDGTQVHLEIGAPTHASALLAELVPAHLVPSA